MRARFDTTGAAKACGERSADDVARCVALAPLTITPQPTTAHHPERQRSPTRNHRPMTLPTIPAAVWEHVGTEPTVCISCGDPVAKRTAKRCRRCSYANQRCSTLRRSKDFPPPTPQATPCLIWQGSLDRRTRYGSRGSSPRRAHRLALVMAGEDQFGTPYSDDLLVMHLCDNPPCFRFDHLRLGTHDENMADAVSKGRTSSGDRRPTSRLTRVDVEEIRRRLDDGETGVALSLAFGVSTSTISKIKTNQTWVARDA